MGRIRRNIIVEGRPCWTLFDTGAKNTYVVSDIGILLPKKELDQPEQVALGGKVHKYNQICILTALVEGKPVWTDACIIDEIGEDEDRKRIEVLFGALAMQRWEIIPIPEKEELDMSRYKREFVEF